MSKYGLCSGPCSIYRGRPSIMFCSLDLISNLFYPDQSYSCSLLEKQSGTTCATLISLLCHLPLLSQVSLVSELLSSPFSPKPQRAPKVSTVVILSWRLIVFAPGQRDHNRITRIPVRFRICHWPYGAVPSHGCQPLHFIQRLIRRKLTVGRGVGTCRIALWSICHLACHPLCQICMNAFKNKEYLRCIYHHNNPNFFVFCILWSLHVAWFY